MPEDPGSSPADGAVGPVAGLPALDGVTATVALQVSGGPGGDRVVVSRWVDGCPVEVVDAGAGVVDVDVDVDVTLTLPAAEAGEVAAGRLSPSVAYMQGKLKTSGDPGLVLQLLAATATPAFEQWLGRLGTRG